MKFCVTAAILLCASLLGQGPVEFVEFKSGSGMQVGRILEGNSATGFRSLRCHLLAAVNPLEIIKAKAFSYLVANDLHVFAGSKLPATQLKFHSVAVCLPASLIRGP